MYFKTVKLLNKSAGAQPEHTPATILTNGVSALTPDRHQQTLASRRKRVAGAFFVAHAVKRKERSTEELNIERGEAN